VKGQLIIAGGNIKDKAIYEKFLELADEDNKKIAIIPTASLEAQITLEKHIKIFTQCGIAEDRIIGIKVDPDFKMVGNEHSDWKNCGDDFENLDFLNDVKGIWFTGGDQIKIIKSFIRSDGSDTKLLKKIRDILGNGGVVGGSSAGAAIMSEVMIGGGTSLGARDMPIFKDYEEYRKIPELEDKGVLLITKGLGFLKEGIIDQHFDERNRIGRLSQTLYDSKVNRGYGISENTAVVYDIEKGNLGRIGCGGVTIIDMADLINAEIENYSEIKSIKISYLEGDDIYNTNEDKFYLEDKITTKEQEWTLCQLI
jgi:cyanophycinase